MELDLFLEDLRASRTDVDIDAESTWSVLTSLGAGLGRATLVTPHFEEALGETLALAAAKGVGVFILGGGTNIVGSDKPLRGIVIRLGSGFSGMESDGPLSVVGAGTALSKFTLERAGEGFGGVAGLAGIPGTIGGAVAGNAGADGCEIGDVVESLRGFRVDGTSWSAEGSDIEWRYRGATLPEGVVLVEVTCRLEPVDSGKEIETIHKLAKARRSRFPKGRSAGCAFRNPTPELPAGRLLDEAGCKGLASGLVSVSDEHANFIIAREGASESDVVGLMSLARRRVFHAFGIILKPEVGFVSNASKEMVEASLGMPSVLVLKGGDSSEREVSLMSGAAVERALRIAGFDVIGEVVSSLDSALAAVNAAVARTDIVVFPVLHGGYGEDGRLQKGLEERGISFVGCGSKGCALAMDKIASKKIMAELGIPTPAFAVVERGTGNAPPDCLSLPLVLKPAREGSSVGMAIVESLDDWGDALDKAFEFDDEVLVEEFVEGVEITVGVVDGKTFPAVEIRYPGKMYDYDAKYEHKRGDTLYFCPPENLSKEVLDKVGSIAVAFAKGIDSLELTRVDMMIVGDEALVLEANNLPGCTSHSLLPKAAAAGGVPFPSLCGGLVRSAVARGVMKKSSAD